jgi:hypothetical protein
MMLVNFIRPHHPHCKRSQENPAEVACSLTQEENVSASLISWLESAYLDRLLEV